MIYVLNKNLVEFASGVVSDNVGGGSYKDFSIAFPSGKFSSAPSVVASLGGGSSASTATSLYGMTNLTVYNISSTGCTIRFYNGGSTTLTPSIQWIALSLPAD